MSLFIAGEAFRSEADFEAAKIAFHSLAFGRGYRRDAAHPRRTKRAVLRHHCKTATKSPDAALQLGGAMGEPAQTATREGFRP
jgi:hypothetical protein